VRFGGAGLWQALREAATRTAKAQAQRERVKA